jgi:hypothetical protein
MNTDNGLTVQIPTGLLYQGETDFMDYLVGQVEQDILDELDQTDYADNQTILERIGLGRTYQASRVNRYGW